MVLSITHDTLQVKSITLPGMPIPLPAFPKPSIPCPVCSAQNWHVYLIRGSKETRSGWQCGTCHPEIVSSGGHTINYGDVAALRQELADLVHGRAPVESSTCEHGTGSPGADHQAEQDEQAEVSTAEKERWTGGVKRQYRDIPTAIVDAQTGLALFGDETIQLGARPELLAILRGLPERCERIYLTGARPGDGSAEGLYTWLRDPRIGEEWKTGKLHIDADLPVLELSHRTGKRNLSLRRMAAWFGEGDYTPPTARAALATLDRLLTETFDSRARCLTTPGMTGLDLFNRSRACEYPVLDEQVQTLIADNTAIDTRPVDQVIRSSTGQGRIELCPHLGRETLPGFVYLDGRFMYAALCKGLGFGPAQHDTRNEFDPYRRGRYHIRFTVPQNWQHVGLFAVKHDDSQRGWFYPGQESAGKPFDTWADATEIRLALAPPRGLPAWNIQIEERLLLQSASAGHPWPLDVWSDKLIAMRARAEWMIEHGELAADIGTLVLAAIRAILLHGVGSFHRARREELVIVYPQDKDDLRRLPAEYAPVPMPDGTWVYRRPVALSAWSQALIHPEFSAAIWARCRTHLLYAAKKQGRGQIAYETGALTLPREWLIAMRTDALYGASNPNWPDDGKTPGQFRLKGLIPHACAQPGAYGRPVTERDYAALNRLRDESELYLKSQKKGGRA